MFNNQRKQDEAFARETQNNEKNTEIIETQLPEHGEDEQLVLQTQKERSELIRWQQDLDDEALKFVMELRGFYLSDTGWQRDTAVEPLASEEFIRRIKPLLVPSISRNQMMTNYSEERILRSLKRTASSFVDILFIHGEELGVKKQDFSMLVSSFQAAIEPTYYRALQNGERKYLTTIHKHVETKSDSPQQKKKGLFSMAG